jgi:predicted dinucleotide-binding enzyme
MDISIIGTGSIGGTLARNLARAGHAVAIANSRGPASLAREIGATAAETAEAVARAGVLIVSVPVGALPGLGSVVAKHLPAPAIVVDTNNYVPEYRDEHIAAIDDGLVESLWVEERLRRPVIKAFNTLGAASLAAKGRPPRDPGRIAAPVSGDDAAAKRTVIALLDELGFDGFDAADLGQSWRQEPGTPVFTTDLPLDQAREAIAAAAREHTAAWRKRMAEARRS